MEQATNQFNQGLQLDSHPMVQGNNTLTDCLNGTLITMNGNEIVLQNDMGNRRVDNAFLPSGYEPVGIKEYGGIIYIAAYNPITNKSQIGSFPSPEKKISGGKDLSVEFDFKKFISDSKKDELLGGISVLESDSYLVPLTGENVLRAGDKFAIYSTGLNEISEDLTNYNNTYDNDRTKALSPKNKLYTLFAGILNSQNEFVDITKTLGRWKNDVIQVYDSSVSDIYKFNDGYFIANSKNSILGGDTIADYNLIKERQKLAINTYAYKLVGPLYLKVVLNHIDNFNYNIYGTYDKESNTAMLTIEGFITYNCPDDAIIESNNSNKDYSSFEEGRVKFNGFDFYSNNGKLVKLPPTNPTYGNSVYNPETNLYSVKIVKSYKLESEDIPDNKIFNYILAVDSGLTNDNGENIYLKGLSVKGSIDLSLLGSGKVSVKSWKFYNNQSQGSTILSFALDAYPEYGKHFENLRFKFTDITNTKNVVNYPQSEVGLPVYNGKQTITIDWNGSGFKPRTTYRVEITYDIVPDTGNSTRASILENNDRWFLTTELFNELYFTNKEIIEDYCNTNSGRFKELLKVSSEPTDNFINNSVQLDDVYEGNLLSKSSNIEYSCKHTYHIDITSNPQQAIRNQELYPEYVKVSENSSASNLSVKGISLSGLNGRPVSSADTNHNEKFKECLVPTGSEDRELVNTLNNKQVFDDSSLKVYGNKIIGDIIYYDRYVGKGNLIKKATDVFDSIYNIVEEASPKETEKYGGIIVHKNERGGLGHNDDSHYLYVYYNMNHGRIENDPVKDDNNEPRKLIKSEDKDSGDYKYVFNLYNDLSQVYDAWKDLKSQMFLYLFPNKSDSYQYINWIGKGNYNEATATKYARIWWRTPDGWALFKNLLETQITNGGQLENYDGNLLSFIKKSLSHEYVYCTYPEYSYSEDSENLKLYAPSLYRYYQEYSIPISYTLQYGGEASATIELGEVIGNLIFEKGDSSVSSNDINITLKSSQNFIQEIETFDANNISLIDLKTGAQVDSEGNRLMKNNIYYYDQNNRLVRVANSNLRVDFENMLGNKNTLIYVPNEGNKGVLTYRYDRVYGSADGTTNLDYANIPVVSNV